MFDGTATAVENEFSSAGWIVYQTATVNGENISIKYFHMQEADRVSGTVNAGDIIGYQGDSGNLDNAISQGLSESHVHIIIKDSNNQTVDPEDYLNTTFDEDGNATNNCEN